jgi:hypothetical protein
MAQVVSRRPLTAEARVRARVNPCEICGGQSGIGTGFSPSSSVFPCQYIVTCVRFPWQLDVGALSRNNGIVQHCCVSLDTQQYWMDLASLADNNVNKQHCYARNNRQAFPRSQDCCLRTSTDIISVRYNIIPPSLSKLISSGECVMCYVSRHPRLGVTHPIFRDKKKKEINV